MEKSRLLWAASDSWVMLQRNIKHLVRNPESLFINIFLPVVLMLMFVYVFGGAIQTGTAYVNYIVPGIIIFCAGYGSSMTAVSVSQDRLGGLFERLRSMPVHPSSFMLGHVIGSFVRNAISAALVFVVAFLLGFRPEAGWLDWLGVVLLLSLFILSVCCWPSSSGCWPKASKPPAPSPLSSCSCLISAARSFRPTRCRHGCARMPIINRLPRLSKRCEVCFSIRISAVNPGLPSFGSAVCCSFLISLP